jgi:GABA(A) receptor-associated protein
MNIQTLSFPARRAESIRLREKYSDRIPVLCVASLNSKDQLLLKKQRFLIPNNFTAGQFLHLLRKQVNLRSDVALYIFINNMIPATSQDFLTLDNEHRSLDGFLYVSYATESTFG